MSDPKYDHFTKNMFTPRNVPERNTNSKEASEVGQKIDWSKMKGWDKPFEASTDSLDGVTQKDDGDGVGR